MERILGRDCEALEGARDPEEYKAAFDRLRDHKALADKLRARHDRLDPQAAQRRMRHIRLWNRDVAHNRPELDHVQVPRARESSGRAPVRRRGSRRATAPTRGSPDDPDDDGDAGPGSARAEPLRPARPLSRPAPRHLGRDILPGVLAELVPDTPAERLQRHLQRMREVA